MTTPLRSIHDFLRKTIGASYDDVLFGLSEGNRIGTLEEYLFDTPHNLWSHPGQAPRGHSNHLPAMVRKIVGSASTIVDILTMDEPTGEFRKAVEDGIADALKAGRSPLVRILIGRSGIGARLVTHRMLQEMANELRQYATRPEIYLAQFRYHPSGPLPRAWNHAKLIAADGRVILTGGHNLWPKDYLFDNPVFDISVRYEGPVAAGGHRFANGIWAYVRDNNRHGSKDTYCNSLKRLGPYEVGEETPPGWEPGQDTPIGTIPALWVTNAGWGVFTSTHSGCVLALHHALSNPSVRRVRISQQDLGSKWRTFAPEFTPYTVDDIPYDYIRAEQGNFNLWIINALADYLLRHPDNKLEMVVTSADGGDDYNNKIPLRTIFNVIGNRVAHLGNKSKEQVLELFNRQFTLKQIASNSTIVWPNQWPKRSHAKFWMVDDLVYVGSENFYPSFAPPDLPPANLQEFGIIAEVDAPARDLILGKYFDPMFKTGFREFPRVDRFTWPGN